MGFFRLLGEAISGLVGVAIGPRIVESAPAARKVTTKKQIAEKKKAHDASKKKAAKRDADKEAAEKEAQEVSEGIIPARLFTEQAFLMDHLKTYAEPPTAFPETKFATRTNEPQTNKKNTLNEYIKNYFELGPKELAVMKPFVRIMKGNVGLPLTLLGNNHEIEKAIGAPLYAAAKKKRIPQIALKSMTGQIINKHMAFTKMKFTLEIFCSDMDTFRAERGGWALIDLIRRKPKGGEVINPDLASLSQQTVDIEFGWFSPPKRQKPKGSTIAMPAFNKINKYVSPGTSWHQSVSYKVSILKHDIAFNKDGSFNITMEFNGTYNSALRSPTANVLFDPEGEYYKHLTILKNQADHEAASAKNPKLSTSLKAQAIGRRDIALQMYEQEKKEVAPLVYNEFWQSIRNQSAFLAVSVSREVYDSWTAGAWIQNPPEPSKGKSLKVKPSSGDAPADNAEHKPTPPDDKVEDVRKITYFPLGALLNILVQNAVKKLQMDSDTAALFKHGFYVQFGSLAFLHSPMGVEAGSTQMSVPPKALPKVLLVGIGSLPISLELFRAWMIKFFISGRRLEVTLDEALKEFITSLVLASGDQTSAISLTPYQQKIQGLPIQIGDTMLGLYYEGASEVEALNEKWMVGDEKADQNRGVYHFKPLQAQAVVRDFSFNRVDMKGVTEMMSKGSVLSQTGIPRSKYSISLTLWGNTHLKIGQRIFVDPSALVGNVNSPENQQLGMGGYYGVTSVTHRISSNGFFTDVEALWTNFGKASKLIPKPPIDSSLMAKKQRMTYAPPKSTVPDKNKQQQTKAETTSDKGISLEEREDNKVKRKCETFGGNGKLCQKAVQKRTQEKEGRSRNVRVIARGAAAAVKRTKVSQAFRARIIAGVKAGDLTPAEAAAQGVKIE